MFTVEMFTDGACKGNPGKGGWGCMLRCGERVKEISGSVLLTTNNRMELRAVIEGLKLLKAPCVVLGFSDSQYVVNGITKWINKEKRTSWDGVKNGDLWKEIYNLCISHRVSFEWVKGHNGHKENEVCDTLANKAIEFASAERDYEYEKIMQAVRKRF